MRLPMLPSGHPAHDTRDNGRAHWWSTSLDAVEPSRPSQESPTTFGPEIPKGSPSEGLPALGSKKCPKQSQSISGVSKKKTGWDSRDRFETVSDTQRGLSLGGSCKAWVGLLCRLVTVQQLEFACLHLFKQLLCISCCLKKKWHCCGWNLNLKLQKHKRKQKRKPKFKQMPRKSEKSCTEKIFLRTALLEECTNAIWESRGRFLNLCSKGPSLSVIQKTFLLGGGFGSRSFRVMEHEGPPRVSLPFPMLRCFLLACLFFVIAFF